VSVHAPTFIVITWGCQMNEDDSDQISGILMQMGYQPTDEEKNADVIVLNTCSVRAKPEQKVRSKLGELKRLKLARPDILIVVCGCLAQRMGESITKFAPYVDIIIGTAQIPSIPELIEKARISRKPVSALELPDSVHLKPHKRIEAPLRSTLKAFVPVMYGCNNFCTYCIVPYVRGAERSRPLAEILEEVQRLAEKGCKEVTLLGQNVNSYSGGVSFAELLAELDQKTDIQRIRFTTSHPKDLSDELISAIASLPKVCEHIHLPIQAGDNDVLRAMNRGYSVEQYIEKVSALRKAVPDISLTTDILVGFPGETDKQFENTLSTIETIRFDAAFMFAFDAIPGTAAASLPNQLPTNIKHSRLREVIELQNRITVEINESLKGSIFEVLVEGSSPRDSNKLTGLTRQNKTVNFIGEDELSGHFVKVRAVTGKLYGFVGELI